MKKKVLFILFLVFLLPLVNASLKIEKTAEVDTVIPELNQAAVFNFKITNLGSTDTFSIYSLVGVNFYPNESFSIVSGETKELTASLWPEQSILETPGTLNFVYKISGASSGIQEDVIAIKITNLKNVLDINSYNIHLDSDKAIIYVKNMAGLEFPEIKADFHSAFFDFSRTFSLGKYEKKEFEVELNKAEMKKLVAGDYIITTDFETKGVKARTEKTFKFTEKAEIRTEESNSGIFISRKITNKINEGNLPFVVQVIVKKNALSRLFTTFNIEPGKVEREGFAIYYTFQKEIKPSEILSVKVTTNWFYPLILLLFLAIIGFLIHTVTSTSVILRKKATFVKTKGGEFALKITLFVKAKDFAEKIKIVDRIPALVKLYERFGVLVPDKIDEKSRRLEWYIESLQPGEERVFSYVIYSKISPIGKFELPIATALFEKEGKMHEAESNRVYFLTEPRKRLE